MDITLLPARDIQDKNISGGVSILVLMDITLLQVNIKSS